MKVLKIVGYILCILICSSCSKVSDDIDVTDKIDENNVDGNSDVDENKVYYVSSLARGRGTGEEALHAADFLNDDFWANVQRSLQTHPVTVKFAIGDYSRAYTLKTFTLKNIGHTTHRLTLEGTPQTIFTAPTGHVTKSLMVSIMDSQNITICDFHFRGEGSVTYVLRVSSTPAGGTKNILIENCSWIDMPGVVAGAAGTLHSTTSHVTFKNCTFKKIGTSTGHMIYNAHHAHHISVTDSHFEDCPGDYVRFRDNVDYALVSGSTFIHNKRPPTARPFISMPIFNKESIEIFGTNYAFINNIFVDHSNTLKNVIAFHHYGHNRTGFDYLLTPEEGDILTTGTVAEKKHLLLKNFGINMDLVRVYNNRFPSHIDNKVALGSFASYGGSKGWEGFVEIHEAVKNSSDLFSWEQY